MRVQTGLPTTLSHTFDDDSETAVDAGTVNVTVTDSEGGAVAGGVASQDADHVYTFALPAQSELGELQVDWVASDRMATDYVEVVGARIFDLAYARKTDPFLANMTDVTTDDLKRVREYVEDEFQDITNRSFIPRRNVEYFDLDGTGWVLTDEVDLKAIVSADVDGTALDLSTLEFDLLGTVSGLPDSGRLTLTYEYGWKSVPSPVERVAIVRARYILQQEDNGIPDRATSFQVNGEGIFRLATPGKGGSETGIPEVDAVLARHTINPPGVA